MNQPISSLPETPAHAPETGAVSATTPTSMILFLLLIFPPAAWYLMWINKPYHHWFGKLLIISGVIALFITLSSFATIGAGLDQLYASLGVTNSNAELITLTNYLGIGFALLQIFFGFYLQHRLRHAPSLTRFELLLAIVLLAGSLYVALIPSLLIFQDLYPAIYKLYQGPSY